MDTATTTTQPATGRPVANAYNLARAFLDAANGSTIDLGLFQDVTDVRVDSTVFPAASDKSASFGFTMVGPNLNPGNHDTRRIFTVRVTRNR